MPRHVEVQDLPPVVTDHEKAVEQSECDGRDREEIHCCDGFAVVPKKRQPTFGQLWVSRRMSHPAGDGPLGDIKSDHQEFPMNSRRSPGWILNDHAKNQIANFLRHAPSPNEISTSGNGAPIELEASTMPAHDGVWNDEDEVLLPARPKLTDQDTEQFIERWDV
jgi:hypothetical protein